ncbi:FtsH protease activity modulator HflK [Bacillus sp. FJAT-42376]|uniref:FtsH protease activity modulator HflK n=1 Tax=Bacillus sp. FJAT-42376 TaxID=2014076 RepID=UPI000F4EB4AE|nr:FtsH protease activity modulator HflK [Bacillus sp. FJAT-42376]AZB43898.1 FtsH protease activity modulator HflK [Bacillus sp. FJAT-42376]
MTLKRLYALTGLAAAIAAALILAFTTWFTVDESDQAVIMTLGEVQETVTESGLHMKWPWPIQKVEKLSKETFSLQFGYKEKDGKVEDFPAETKMITGDENIVLADMVVQWKISDPKKFLFSSAEPEEILYDSTSSSLRSIIGGSKIDDALTSGKADIEKEVQKLLGELMKKYDIGISILAVKLQDVDLPNEEVRKSFTNVTDARETMNTKINEAKKYENQKREEALGEKDAIISKAQGDKTARIQKAIGETSKFNALYSEYRNAKEITQKRLILETIDQVLPGAQIYIMKDDGNTMKYLPIMDPGKGAQTAPPAAEQNPAPAKGSETNGQ